MSYKNTDLIKKFQLHSNDTGSSAVQIVQLTDRINSLTEHFNVHGKDKNSKRGFLTLISRRKKLIKYYLAHNKTNNNQLFSDLSLRK